MKISSFLKASTSSLIRAFCAGGMVDTFTAYVWEPAVVKSMGGFFDFNT